MPTVCVPDTETAVGLADLTARHADLAIIAWRPESPAPVGLDEIEFLVPGYAGGVSSLIDLAQLPSLKVIQTLTAGVEAWLDRVPAGVVLCSGRGIHGGSTAELALAGMLSHLRQLPRFAAAQRRHVWDHDYTAGLRGQRILVLGAGDIGARVAEVARIFEAEVTVVARRPRAGVHGLAELPVLLRAADIVVIALPNTPATTGLVDATFLAALPDGALVVNVARGAVVVTDALVAELSAGRLFAFLDVFEDEPLPADHPLWDQANAVLTPHVGGGTTGWQAAATQLIHDQVARYLDGEPLANVVTEGY